MIFTYQISSAIASTISGVTSTRKTSAMKTMTHLPGRLASAMPASDPRMVAMMAEPTAAFNEVVIAPRITGLSGRVLYQSTPNPSQASNARPLLNE